jgi:hypothetical protein
VNPAAPPLQNAVLRFDAEIFAGSATQIVVRSVPYRRLAAAQCEQGEAAGQLRLGPDDRLLLIAQCRIGTHLPFVNNRNSGFLNVLTIY